jgi:integrase
MVETAMRRARTPSLKWLILLTWVTCARGGCARQLAREDLILKGNDLSVTFYRGKRASIDGAYTIHTSVPTDFTMGLSRWLASRPRGLLFPGVTGSMLVAALRASHPRLEQRSLRRGSIQTMAKSGISEERLLDFSGHKSLPMLRRYLDFGVVAPYKHEAVLAARLLTT